MWVQGKASIKRCWMWFGLTLDMETGEGENSHATARMSTCGRGSRAQMTGNGSSQAEDAYLKQAVQLVKLSIFAL